MRDSNEEKSSPNKDEQRCEIEPTALTYINAEFP